MNRKRAVRTVAVLSGIGVGLSVFSHFLTKKLAELALDRDAPKSIEKIRNRVAGSGAMKDVFEKVRQDAEELEQTPHEQIVIQSFDGYELVGHFFPVQGAKRTLMAFHGWRSKWSVDFGLSRSFWAESGCQVLYVEQRGQNASGGDYMGFGLLERYDVAAWAKEMARRQPDLPIYLCGISMGATSVLMAADLDLPDQVHGIMADCGFTSPYAIWKHVSQQNLHLPYDGVRAKIVNDICRQRIHMRADEYSTVSALQHTKKPVFFVHGTDDHFVPVTMTYENYLACAGPKELLIVPGADHGLSCMVEPEKYHAACRQFWERYD